VVRHFVIDIMETISVAFGVVDVSFYILVLFVLPEFRFNPVIIFSFLIVGIIGLIPLYSSKHLDYQKRGIITSFTTAFSLFPWLILILSYISNMF